MMAETKRYDVNEYIKQHNEYIKQYKDKILEQIKEENPIFTNRDESGYGIGFADGRMSRDREIIRCRDCKHRFESMEMTTINGNTVQLGHYCKATGQIVSNDDFCAWAERETDNDDA